MESGQFNEDLVTELQAVNCQNFIKVRFRGPFAAWWSVYWAPKPSHKTTNAARLSDDQLLNTSAIQSQLESLL